MESKETDLAEVLLNELRTDDADEGGGRRVRYGLDQHRLSRPCETEWREGEHSLTREETWTERDLTWRTVQQHTARRVDTDLAVEIELKEGNYL